MENVRVRKMSRLGPNSVTVRYLYTLGVKQRSSDAGLIAVDVKCEQLALSALPLPSPCYCRVIKRGLLFHMVPCHSALHQR